MNSQRLGRRVVTYALAAPLAPRCLVEFPPTRLRCVSETYPRVREVMFHPGNILLGPRQGPCAEGNKDGGQILSDSGLESPASVAAVCGAEGDDRTAAGVLLLPLRAKPCGLNFFIVVVKVEIGLRVAAVGLHVSNKKPFFFFFVPFFFL